MKGNKLRKKIIISSFTILITLTGCGSSPSGKENLPKENVELPDMYEAEMDRVKFHTKVVVPEEFNQDALMKTTARKRLPDTDKVKAHFEEKIQGQKIKEKFDDPPEKEGEAPYYSILTEEGTNFNIADGIRFNTPTAYFFQGVLSYDNAGNLPGEYREPREIPEFLEEEAWEMVEKELFALGYEVEGERESIALPHTFSEEKEYWLAHDGETEQSAYKEEWTGEDDSWYFLMHQNLQGLPVHSEYVFLDNTDIDMPMHFLCSRRGVEEIYIEYYFDFQEEKERVYLLPFEKIAETVAERNNELLTTGEYEVSKAVLCQFVIQDGKEYEVTPAWIVDAIETDEEGVYPFTMIVNAVTGEEILQ